MTLLGFVDDVLELRWRYKLIIPCIATLPLAQAYWSQNGSTTITLPSYPVPPSRSQIPRSHLGHLEEGSDVHRTLGFALR